MIDVDAGYIVQFYLLSICVAVYRLTFIPKTLKNIFDPQYSIFILLNYFFLLIFCK